MQKEKQIIQNSDALKGFLFRAYNARRYKNVGQVLPDKKQNLIKNNSCVVGPEQKLLRTSALLNRAPSSVLTGHLPPHGEAAHFNAPSTWRERAECISTGVRGKIARGFTLIELLVVVLIIGLLAAVALPQYQVAVMRARFAKLYNIARTYERAAQEYIAANGEWPSSFADLIIDAPGGMEVKTLTSATCVQNTEFYCCMNTARKDFQGSGITCGLADYSLAYFYEYRGSLGSQGAGKQCYAKQTNTVANKVCSSYGNSRNGLNLITPQGHQTGYYYYRMPNNF